MLIHIGLSGQKAHVSEYSGTSRRGDPAIGQIRQKRLLRRLVRANRIGRNPFVVDGIRSANCLIVGFLRLFLKLAVRRHLSCRPELLLAFPAFVRERTRAEQRKTSVISNGEFGFSAGSLQILAPKSPLCAVLEIQHDVETGTAALELAHPDERHLAVDCFDLRLRRDAFRHPQKIVDRLQRSEEVPAVDRHQNMNAVKCSAGIADATAGHSIVLEESKAVFSAVDRAGNVVRGGFECWSECGSKTAQHFVPTPGGRLQHHFSIYLVL